ncbi:MAG: hypothetical protein ACRDL6_09070 [Solirubrobacterales bacterium]
MNIPVAAAIIAGACLVTCGLLFALHRFGRRDALLADTARGAGIYGVVGTSFAVLLAFVVLIAFESYIDGREGAEQEADAVLEQFRNAEHFEEPARREIQGKLLCYGRAVISHDWPAMREQGSSQLVNDWGLSLSRTYERVPVRTDKEGWAFGNLLTLSDDRIDSRRQRLTQAVPIITNPVWFILGLGALLNIAFVLIFVDRRSEALAVQMILMAGVTAVVVAGLVLVWFLDHPFGDADGSVEPVEMERTVTGMEEVEPDLSAPCTGRGDALD